MTNDYKRAQEEHFLQGLSSAKGGLPAETCPHPWTDDSAEAASSWGRGWSFGKLVLVQTLRKEKSDEIKAAIAHLFSYQVQYAEGCRIQNQGFFKAGLKYFAARRESNEIARHIMGSKEYRLLKDVGIDFFIPWRPSEAPYSFRLHYSDSFQRYYSAEYEQSFRKLVNQYGESHGILAAWRDYQSSTPVEDLLPPDHALRHH
jgi:hypothetical protein